MINTICYIVSIKAKPEWLKVGRDDRKKYWKKVSDIVQEFAGKVSFEYFDADAFHAAHSDIVICETTDLIAYHHMWDRIKDTSIFTQEFYEITDVRMGIKGVSHG